MPYIGDRELAPIFLELSCLNLVQVKVPLLVHEDILQETQPAILQILQAATILFISFHFYKFYKICKFKSS